MNAVFLAQRPPVPINPGTISLDAETAVETAALLGLGMRRLAADLGLIRLLVYYGAAEDDRHHHEEGHQHHHEDFDPRHPEKSWGGGDYPELGPRAMRILDIDPFFSYPALYSAGALAFNLNRPQDALRVLQYGLSRDPQNLQYRTYIGAVGFHRNGDMRKVIELLEPALASPDCPTMIKSMMAFLYKRAGMRQKAIRLYREILETSRDLGYQETAERMLGELVITERPIPRIFPPAIEPPPGK